MKRILYIVLLAVLLPMSVMAQDARQRTPQTIVADVLAEAPYGQRADFEQAMNDLLGTGSTGVTNLAAMLVPAAEGDNNRVEYVLDGLVAYAAAHATPAQLDAVCEGLARGAEACNDTPNKAFMLTLLTRISRPADAEVFLHYLDDAALAEWAVAGLIKTPGIDDNIVALVNADRHPRAVLARMVGEKGISAAETTLTKWLKTATPDEARAIYRALAKAGTAKSLAVLGKAAAAEKYQWLPTDATASYITLLNRLALNPADSKDVIKDAQSLLKKAKSEHVRIAAMTALFRASGAEQAPMLYKAMQDADRRYRVAALRACEGWVNDDIYNRLGEIAASDKTPAEVSADIVSWLGTNRVASQLDAILACANDENDELAAAAMAAAARIGGNEAMQVLVAQLDGKHAEQAFRGLLAFNGDVSGAIVRALEPSNSVATRRYAMAIAMIRRVKDAAPYAMAALDDAAMADIAYPALSGVVTPADIPALCTRLDNAPEQYVAQLQNALIAALGQLPAAEQYNTIVPIMNKSRNQTVYYPALATIGNWESIKLLSTAYKDTDTRAAALGALLKVDSPDVMNILYNVAETDADANAEALKRYTQLVDKYVDTPVARYQQYKRALEASKSADVDNMLIARLADTGTYQALEIADRYIARPENADAAAAAIRAIMSKHVDEYYNPEARAALVKAAAQFKTHPADDADAGYAVDDINGMLVKLDARAATAAAPTSALTPEEAAEGFEMLFDGTSLRKWTGDTTTYIVKDGCITVSAAHWGNNIYTVDQYGDFVLRFEFALDRPGVNNGVGIRTPMNVDAAFHGMEIQILDHDDPMYRDLQPYQVHGSVYGVIPAKRVKFKHGEWNTEEIRAQGDHITVTVNGKVILDGNIRDACQGHNVGDPGEQGNHWMVDHRNHPGLFNKSGHIGFLGHGDGIRFRNVRVKTL